jgi:hypothetical protein
VKRAVIGELDHRAGRAGRVLGRVLKRGDQEPPEALEQSGV